MTERKKLPIGDQPRGLDRFIPEVTALDHVRGRADAAQLTTSGITFKNVVFHDEAVTTALLDDLSKAAPGRSQPNKTYAPARVLVAIKWNPADASSISVWNSGGKPAPHYVTLPNRLPDSKGTSFQHWDKIREFAEQQELDFNVDADRSAAREKLRKHWERLAGKLPMRSQLTCL